LKKAEQSPVHADSLEYKPFCPLFIAFANSCSSALPALLLHPLSFPGEILRALRSRLKKIPAFYGSCYRFKDSPP
jgi:hypothetical protein